LLSRLSTRLYAPNFSHASNVALKRCVLPVTQGGAMPDNTDLNPGDEAAPGTPGTGENLRPGCSGSGKNDGPKGEQCIGSGKVIEGIRGA
jgi:hypothetical protein